MTRLERLLWAWDEGTLSDTQKAELVAALEHPDARRLLVRHWLLSRSLTDSLPLVPSPSQSLPRPRVAPWALAVAAALVLLLAGLWMLGSRPEPLARLVEVSGKVAVVEASGRSSVGRPGQPLFVGQSIQAGDEDDGYAALEYPDSTRLELHAGSGVRLDVRRVVCTGGTVRAAVAGGSLILATSQGEVHTQEGLMLVSTSADSMRVDLEEGNAEVIRTGDANAVEMGSGSYTVATPGPVGPIVRALPTALTRRLRQVEIRNGRILRYGPDDRLESVAARWLRTATKTGEVRVEPLVARKPERLALGGGRLAIASVGQIAIYDLNPLSPLRSLSTRGLGPVALANDGSWVSWVDARKFVLHVTRLDDKPSPAPVFLGGKGPFVLTASPTGVVVAGGGRVRVFGTVPANYSGLPDTPKFLAVAEKTLAAATTDGTLTVWRSDHAVPLHSLRQHARAVTALAVSPSGEALAAGTADGQVWLFRITDGQPRGVIRAGKRAVWGLAFHSDGERLAVGVQNGPLAEWAIPQP